MKIYRLHSTQKLPISMDEAWDFFSDPANLKVITPEHMGFEIQSGADRKMYAGQIIKYVVKPFPWMPTKWVTEITHVNEGKYFVDEQRFGPYSLWHHKHFFRPVEGGVEMEDIVDYKLPLGILGRIMHSLVVRKQLNSIFSYREEKLIKLFGSYKGEARVLEMKTIKSGQR
ncbi:SRPBCC family protein [Robertkochia flava]|uniref:SRPBCC family protein n=1 Tax=Robertkochia flava TaxID=3447986 RepID=UPI001CCEF13A|nr:SRPBCC family protein [Robertkochia marina]